MSRLRHLRRWNVLHARNQALVDRAKSKKKDVKAFRFKGGAYEVIRTTDYELFFFRGEHFIKSPPKELKKRARQLFAQDDAKFIHES